MKKQSAAREAFILEQRQAGKFRALRAGGTVGSSSSDTGLTSFDNIADYKALVPKGKGKGRGGIRVKGHVTEKGHITGQKRPYTGTISAGPSGTITDDSSELVALRP